MKIVSNLLTSIEGIQIFYIIGLLIFVALFIVIVIRTIRRPKKEMDDIKNSIIEDDDTEDTDNLK
ncbi:CcoQ/FixQ family Cbb3-type cytochrome c oxidase assembly chaperone [Draconibacterium halophilum]|uniref:CcoQ/FixQ family Cbb3-type cytochrome c oxidase assembly chaperone n=1 Tax=Draconibacterium halophilum TaxID=2706887 RepID=A0A6C0RI41_9BACT|nr:CcoQ/FixQ family Cbb3-type cytochrome c oxidase assembly chaperone [Draconibacterium halophilum]QIA09706.1 CcoQ/FixQ family Cbb3-type cytochrome c oxidase assembly chaperone [Draconibacterium halophilum]